MNKKSTIRFVWKSYAFFIFLLSCASLQAQRFVHPSIPFTRADLDQLKANITKVPWLTGYNALANDSRSKLSYVMQGPFTEVGRAPDINRTQWQSDMLAIHNITWMYVFTGDSAYARKATNMLDAWAVTNTIWSGTENMLDLGDYAPYYVVAADILRGTFPGWTADNTAHVKSYFANVIWPTSWVPNPLRDQNKGALQLDVALGTAAFLDDSVKWNQAVNVYRMDAGGGMRNSLPNGEVGDAGRDDHWFTQIEALGWCTEVAWKQGVDLFAEYSNRMLAIGELYDRYSFEGSGMSFIPFGGYATYWTNWGIAPGVTHQHPFNNIINGAYSLRKGIPTPYTDKMRALVGEGSWSFLYLKSVDTSTATPLTPLVFPTTDTVTQLTNIDIGNPGIAGSVSNNNGVWTVNGAGVSVASAVNYTFKPITGDAAIIIKVEGNALSAATTGLMIRDSLGTGANYVSVNLGNGFVNSFSKGSSGTTAGTHYPPKAPWWLKLERVGNRVFTYHSQDGVNWTNNALFIMSSIPSNAYMGFYTLSNNTSALNTATISHLGITNTAAAGAPVITSATSANAVLGTAFSYAIAATGSPTSYSAVGLPAGLSIDPVTGAISGTPAILGTFTVTLNATNANGTGTAVLVIYVTNNTAPAAPAGLTASVVNSTQVSLAWTASANATGYTIKRSLVSGGPYTVLQSGITGVSFVDANPVPEVPNYYVVTALAGTLESGISNEVSQAVPPGVPSQPVVINKSGEIDLSWGTANGAVTYKVKRAALSGGPYTVIAQVSATSYADTAVSNGNGYYYVVSSVGHTLESANSAEVFGVPGSNGFTWSASPASASWSQAANWVEGAAPASPAIITFRASADTVLTNDISGLQVSRILFDTTANAYTITGNGITPKTDLVNNSSMAQTVNVPLVLNNQLNVTTNTMDIYLPDTISGTGGLLKTGNGILYITGNNTYSGNTTLNGAGQGWPPIRAIAAGGAGTGTSGAPASGPLGTGLIIMNGGALFSSGSDATLYNDVIANAGTTSYIYQTSNAVNLYGHLKGSGTIIQDGNVYAGLHLYGDNSGFTGTFVSKLRSGNNRLRFEAPQAGSANATWLLDATGVDCQSTTFASGTISFGALTGRGYIRNDGGGSPVISIGALNTSTSFGGTIVNLYNIEKVGTGSLTFTGNHTYYGTTTIRNGTFLLNNNPSTGSFASPVMADTGTFGGTGRSTAPVTIGTGSGAGAILAPGSGGIGTLTTGTLTLNHDATYLVEMSTGNRIADKMRVPGTTLVNNPLLSITAIDSGVLAPGTSFTIIEDTLSTPVTGTFRNLPELSQVTVNGYHFRITYKGGDGNDIVLMDERTMPVTISSATADTTLIGRSYTYTITAIKSPTRFHAAGLPAGLVIDTTTGIISGAASVPGIFPVTLTASNDTSTGTATLNLVVKSNVADGVIVAAGDARNIVEWNAILNLSYHVKRSNAPAGPFTTIGNATAARYIDSTVSNGSTYYYVVASVDSGTEYPNSAVVPAMPNTGQLDYWKFDESSGTKAIDAWGANHGVLAATAGRDTGYASGSLKLNGTATAYASLPAGIFSTLNNFTITAWVRMDSIATWMRVFDFGTGTSKYLFLTVQAAIVSGKQTIRYSIKNGGGEQQVNFNYALAKNTWTHFAVTQSGNTCSLYINGTLVATNTGVTIKPATIGSTNLNYIGKSQYASDPMFRGSIDEFKVYSRALSAAEIAAAMQADQTISFNPIAQKTIGDTDFAPVAIASSGLAVSYTSSDSTVAAILNGYVHIVGAGTAVITATQAGNSKFKAAVPVAQLLTVVKKTQTISFNALPDRKTGDTDFVLTATASSGLPLYYSSSDTTVAAVTPNGLVHIAGGGTATITASQPGNAVYAAASAVMQPLTVYVPPVVKTKNLQVAVDSSGNASIIPQQVDSGSVSYNGALTLSLDKTTFHCSDIGSPVVVTLTGTDAKGYTGTATAIITVADLQSPLVTSPSAQVFCYSSDSSYHLPAMLASDNCGIASTTYTITGATSGNGTGADASGVFHVGVSTVTWTVTDVHGNAATAGTTVTVNAPLVAGIPDVYAMNPAVDTKNTIYLGYGPAALTVSATAAGGTAPYTWHWNTGDSTASISAGAAGTYVVDITDAKGCTASASIVISVLDVRCGNNNDKVTICHNGKTICVAAAAVQAHLNHGDYLGSCQIGSCRSITNGGDSTMMFGESGISVYPNPSSGQFVLELNKFKPGRILMTVLDRNGRQVFQQAIVKTLDRQLVYISLNCRPGVYFLKITANEGIETKKIVIQR